MLNEIIFEQAKSGDKIVKVNGYYLHSKFDPLKEAYNFAKKKYRAHHFHIIFGYGMGYIVDALLKETKFNEPILVIDPLIDEEMLNFKAYEKENIYYLPMYSLDVIRSLAYELGSYTSKITFITSINYNNIFAKELKTIAELVLDVQHNELMNINSTVAFSMQWQINYLMNLKYEINDYSLDVLKKKYTAPVVIASGGPSLTKQLPLIKKYRKCIILVCAGSTINSLLNANIEPDYVVSIDGGEPNYNHFKELNLNYSQLIYAPMVHYKIRESFKNDALVMIPHVRQTVQKHLKQKTDKNFPIIAGGGSVAHFSLSIAKYITTGPIALIGQDLAYTNNKTHAEGNKNSIKQKGDIEIEGYYGDKVSSSESFKNMRNTFIEMNYFIPHDNQIFNCTEGGAKIEGYNQVPFELFLEKYTNGNIARIKLPENNQIMKEIILEDEFEKYDRILNLLKQGIEVTNAEQGPVFSPKSINKLSYIEKNLNKLYKETCIDMLLEPIVVFAEHEFLPDFGENKFQEYLRVKKYILTLYETCYKELEDYVKKVKDLMKESEFDYDTKC